MYSVPIELYQPDGTIVQAFATGDSFVGRAYDKDDFTIIRDKETTYYCWAKQGADGWLESTGFPIHLYDPKTLDIKPGESDSPERLEEKRRERRRKQIQLEEMQLNSNTRDGIPDFVPPTGNIHQIVIFISFLGDSLWTTPTTLMDSIFNDFTPGANSLKRYYKDVSYGKLEVDSHLFLVTRHQ